MVDISSSELEDVLALLKHIDERIKTSGRVDDLESEIEDAIFSLEGYVYNGEE